VFKRRTSFLLLPSATLALTIVRLFDEEFSAGDKSILRSLTPKKAKEKRTLVIWLSMRRPVGVNTIPLWLR
jgi:hypothetical protein